MDLEIHSGSEGGVQAAGGSRVTDSGSHRLTARCGGAIGRKAKGHERSQQERKYRLLLQTPYILGKFFLVVSIAFPSSLEE
jgi:hypothetical protein